MVDEGRVSRLLRSVSERSERIRSAGAEITIDDPIRLDALKYQLVTAIEACVDVAQHLVASERWTVPDSNADAIRVLADHDVLDRELAASLARAVGFRNVLVHRYVDVDDHVVIDAVERVREFDDFVEQVGRWLLAGR